MIFKSLFENCFAKGIWFANGFNAYNEVAKNRHVYVTPSACNTALTTPVH